ncbi:MAG TPA: TIM barrel protein [Rubrobacteraceae bacterium]|nr:TIM barrel protein [Rubrobacteraceae bacterium]
MSQRRVAGAPISWGVCEVPGWGYQMNAERVLSEAADLGIRAVEAGPDGFLPPDPEAASGLLRRYGLELVGGFVPAVLHRPETREAEMASVERQAKLFAAAGGGVLVLSASTGMEDYEESVDLGKREWDELFASVAAVEEIGVRHGLSVVLHPHFGTVVERPHQIERFLEGCDTEICLDTGHVMVGGGDPVALVEGAAGRIGHVHLKDVDRGLAVAVAAGRLGYEEAVRRGMYRPLGEGDVELRLVVECLDRERYGGWYVLEQDLMLEAEPGVGDGPIEDVKKSLAFLEEVGA